jgi:hypothetical protein
VTTARVRKTNTWSKQAVVVISNDQGVVAILRSMLMSMGWNVIGNYPTVVGAAFAVREGRATMIVADDMPDQPISGVLRFLLTHPVTIATPVIALSGKFFELEGKSLRSLGRPIVLPKPITAVRLRIALESLFNEWETDDMTRLRLAAYSMQKGDTQGGILRLKQVVGAATAGPLASQALAILLRQIGKLKEAEALLLACLRKDPSNLTVICGLVDIYLNAAMPHLASQLLNATNTRLKPSLILYPDAIQTACMLGEYENALSLLHVLLKAGYSPTETSLFLTRILFAMGREKEAQQLLVMDRGLFLKLQKSWQVADLIPLPAAG